MEEPWESQPENPQEKQPTKPARFGPWAAAVALGCALLLSLGYAWTARSQGQRLASQQAQLTAALDQTHSEIDALTAKVNALSIPPAAAPAPVQTPAASAVAPAHRPRVVEDRRWKKLEEQVTAQQKQIDSTQQTLDSTQKDLATARSQMSDDLNSAKTDLGDSIAKTHDELVALEQKGERNYYEFDLLKSKQFQHVGPISLSLRKANSKHDYFDLAMIVDDVTLDKKHVNLYEPVLIYPADSRQPLELVANRVEKDHIHGYISEPKYNRAATTASNANGANGSGAYAGAGNPQLVPANGAAGGDSASAGTTDTSLQRRPDSQP